MSDFFKQFREKIISKLVNAVAPFFKVRAHLEAGFDAGEENFGLPEDHLTARLEISFRPPPTFFSLKLFSAKIF